MRCIIVIFSLLLLLSCNENSTPSNETTTDDSTTKLNDKIIKVEGSETELHLVESLSEHYISAGNDIEFDITGGGSNTGLEELINGTIDLANSSKKIDASTLKKAQKKGLEIKEAIIAMDAVAIITNEKLGIDSLSNFDLGKIFRGEITNWKEVGGPDLQITVYNRDINSGTYGFIWKKLIQDEFTDIGEEIHDNEELLSKIKTDTSGIGYIGLGYITDDLGKPIENIWSINIFIEGDKAYAPYEISQVIEGNYYLTRPLYQYYLASNEEKVKPFINYEISDEGQLVVFQSHFLPITEEYKIRNEKNGVSAPIE